MHISSGLCDYCASKYAAVGFHESLSNELSTTGKTGVKMTLVCPYYINTGMFDGVSTKLVMSFMFYTCVSIFVKNNNYRCLRMPGLFSYKGVVKDASCLVFSRYRTLHCRSNVCSLLCQCIWPSLICFPMIHVIWSIIFLSENCFVSLIVYIIHVIGACINYAQKTFQ